MLPEKKATLYFATRIGELQLKLKRLFESMGLNSRTKRAIITLEVANPKQFLTDHLDTFTDYFNDMERDEIRLHLHEPHHAVRLEEMIFARPLQHYINSVADALFFEVMHEQSLTSHYQPIIHARSGAIYAYEALVRGVTLDGNLMYPGELFEKADRNDMIFMLDRLARESALKTAAVKKIKQKLFINFVPTAIYDPTFCLQSTVQWAKHFDFNPDQIVFEVVETQKTTDQKHLLKILNFYRDQGFRIALDDVGEGFSSLNMLIKIHPNYIKVDRAIIDHIDIHPMKQSVYKALFETAREHDIRVLAEGIERKEELAFIKEVGVDYVQGYYFGKPAAEPLRRLSPDLVL
jgi:EAL domain-containing protein (putative c-di-GMP-specific phosphodiesterase class I)